MAATIKLSGNRAGWLDAVTSLIMEGGDKPPSVETLYYRAPKLVGPTAANDGHVTAALNGLPRKDAAAGQRLFVDFWIERLRAEGWINDDDSALCWTGPLTGKMSLVVDGTSFGVFDPDESKRAKDESKISDVLIGRGHVNRVQVYKKDGSGVRIASRTGLPERRDLEVHPLALTIPQMTGAEIELLRKDTQEFGIREPLTLFEGKILDGRHRLYMASEYDLPVHLKEFKGDEAAARQYVFSANVVRRQLTVAQKTLAAKELFMPEAEKRAAEALAEGGRKGGSVKQPYRPEAVGLDSQNGDDRGKTAAQIASEMSGGMASARSIERMAHVDRTETPETVEAIEKGLVKGPRAAAEMAAKERGEPPTVLPDNRTARNLAGQTRSYARLLLGAVTEPDGKDGIRAGETLEVTLEARSVLDEAIAALRKTGPA